MPDPQAVLLLLLGLLSAAVWPGATFTNSNDAEAMQGLLLWAEGYGVQPAGWVQGTDPCGTSDSCCSPPGNNTATACSWSGICCAGGNIIQLDLSCGKAVCSSQLAGNLPADELNRLQHLQVLNMSGHHLSAGLPDVQWNLLPIQTLDLSWNNLNRGLPQGPSFTQSPLQVINLSHNGLTGTLPDSWSAMHSLTTIQLANNKLAGQIPSSWVQLTSLTSLDLSYNCGLCGNLPGLPFTLALGRSGTSLGSNCSQFQCGGRDYVPLVAAAAVAGSFILLVTLLYIFRQRIARWHPCLGRLVSRLLPPPGPRMYTKAHTAALLEAAELDVQLASSAAEVASRKPPHITLLCLTVWADTGMMCLERVYSRPKHKGQAALSSMDAPPAVSGDSMVSEADQPQEPGQRSSRSWLRRSRSRSRNRGQRQVEQLTGATMPVEIASRLAFMPPNITQGHDHVQHRQPGNSQTSSVQPGCEASEAVPASTTSLEIPPSAIQSHLHSIAGPSSHQQEKPAPGRPVPPALQRHHLPSTTTTSSSGSRPAEGASQALPEAATVIVVQDNAAVRLDNAAGHTRSLWACWRAWRTSAGWSRPTSSTGVPTSPQEQPEAQGHCPTAELHHSSGSMAAPVYEKPLWKFQLPGVDALVLSPDMTVIDFAIRDDLWADEQAVQFFYPLSAAEHLHSVQQGYAAVVPNLIRTASANQQQLPDTTSAGVHVLSVQASASSSLLLPAPPPADLGMHTTSQSTTGTSVNSAIAATDPLQLQHDEMEDSISAQRASSSLRFDSGSAASHNGQAVSISRPVSGSTTTSSATSQAAVTCQLAVAVNGHSSQLSVQGSAPGQAALLAQDSQVALLAEDHSQVLSEQGVSTAGASKEAAPDARTASQ